MVLNHDVKVSAIKLGPLSTQLPFTGTLSVIFFSKRKENKNTVLIQYHWIKLLVINYCWFL